MNVGRAAIDGTLYELTKRNANTIMASRENQREGAAIKLLLQGGLTVEELNTGKAQTSALFEGAAGLTLIACIIGLALGFSVVGVATFGVFIPALEAEFKWGRGEISVAHTIMSYTTALFAPFIGAAFDRWGVRKVLLPSILGFGLATASLALVNGHLLMFYLAYAALAILGGGTAPTGYMRTLALWFRDNRGLAFGIAMAGVGIGTVFIPLVVRFAVASWGWQAGYLAVAALILGISGPIAWTMLRDPVNSAGQSSGQIVPGLHGLSFSQALRQRSFWLLAFAFPLLGLFTSGLMAHLVPLLLDRGLGQTAAAAGLSVLGVALIFGRLVTGWMLDQVHAPKLIITCIAVAIAGLVILMNGVSGWTAFAAILLIGFVIGAELDFLSYLIARYFGTLAYAKLYGLLYGIFIFGSGIGPLLMGFGFQAYKSYDFPLAVILGILFLTIPAFLALGPYPSLCAAREERPDG